MKQSIIALSVYYFVARYFAGLFAYVFRRQLNRDAAGIYVA